MNYDDIIEDVGGCGLYQKFILALLYVVPVLDGMQTGSIVFIVPEILHRCAIPGLQNDTYEVQDADHANLIQAYIPQRKVDGVSEYDRCHLYRNETLDGNETIYECNSWVYDKSLYQTSVTSDMNLVCSREIFTSHVKTVLFIGEFIVFFLGGWISDRFGRKITIVCSVFIEGISSLASSQATDLYLLVVLRCLSAFGGAGSFGTIFVFVTEITSKEYRSRPALAFQFAIPIGFVFLSMVAYFIRYWKLLMIVISAPLIPLAFLILWLVPESPRWLVCAKKEKQAGKVLNKMAKINKSNFIYEPQKEVETSESNSREVKIWRIFTTSSLLRTTLIMMFSWASMTFVYYGLTLNLGVLVGNIYLNFFLNSLVEIPAIIFTVFFVDRFGRRNLYLYFILAGGVTGMLTIFPYLYASNELSWTITALITFSRMCVSAAGSIIYLYTCELYPTCIRNASIGFFGAFARFGGVLSPYIMMVSTLVPGRLGNGLPLLLMGLVCLVSAILTIFVPETSNKPMQDTFDDLPKSKQVDTNNSVCKEDGIESIQL